MAGAEDFEHMLTMGVWIDRVPLLQGRARQARTSLIKFHQISVGVAVAGNG
jgi:hypothetical protein